MVSGVPRMCMRITPTPASAATGASAGSNASPETSFTTAAPAAIAARATGALRVSTEIGPSRRRANCSITGTTRAISSSTATAPAPGEQLTAVGDEPLRLGDGPIDRGESPAVRKRVGRDVEDADDNRMIEQD